MNAACNTSIAIDIGLTGPPLPVIGLPGILVMANSAISTIVPPIPTRYQGNPHFLIVGSVQNNWAIPATMKNMPILTLKPMTLGIDTECSIPGIAVVEA